MREDLIKELKTLAHEILLLKEEDEIDNLRNKAQEIFEKLTVLDYLNKNSIPEEKDKISENKITSSEDQLKEPILEKEQKFQKETKKEPEPVDETPITLEDLFIPTFDSIKEDMSQKEEFKDTISLDETEKLFHTVKQEPKQLSLNDKLLGSSIQIGLNDRIAFVNNLFNFSQSEFNSVLSSLNGFRDKQEALNYIQYSVKPKYNWKGKEELEERLILIIERKFI
ncbi:MAG: hypothetical protein OEM04_05270 [Flavobacteriaceae bacterium]|nr:hypothetical protein [Flavobacteriaceae bacterium]